MNNAGGAWGHGLPKTFLHPVVCGEVTVKGEEVNAVC